MSLNFKIGYSAWGFLGDGIVDTPDGGRSHRPVLLQSLIQHGAKITMLQKNRDLDEAGVDLSTQELSFDDSGFPGIDMLFLEYRWPILGRNIDVSKNDPAYTPDLDRQRELIEYYNLQSKPIFIWDKDQQLTQDHVDKIGLRNFTIFEPALHPKDGRTSLLFPISASYVDQLRESLISYDKNTKTIDLVYIGNQYDRDESFAKYYNETSKILAKPAEIYGKWTRTESFPAVKFNKRIGYSEVQSVYERSFANIIVAPERYYKNGQYTQRIFESLRGFCLPLIPKEYAFSGQLFPEILIVNSAEDTAAKLRYLRALDNDSISHIFSSILEKLSPFLVDKQVNTILDTLQEYYEK